MSISDTALIAAAERLEELEASNPLLYTALRRMAYLASADRLKTDSPEDVLAKIRECAKEATDAVDACTLAVQKRGMEIADEEAMAQLNTYGYSMLSDKGKLLAIAARKREQSRNGEASAQADGVMSEGTGPVRSLFLHRNHAE